MVQHDPSIYKNIQTMIDQRIKQAAADCLHKEIEAVQALIPRLDDTFVNVIELLHACKGKVVVTGVGKSGHIGSKIAATLASTGTPAFFLNPLDAYHGDLGMIGIEDVVLAISYSGATDELLRLIPLLQAREIPIVAFSGKNNSLLAQNATYHLDISVACEADPLNLVPTSSTTVTLALGDAIACALMRRRDFKESDFAQFHPGGDLGKRLLSRVRDYMINSNLPIVKPDTKVCDAIFEISKNKQGIAVVISENIVTGAITDGDIRRAMQKNKDDFFSLTVSEIMNHDPKTIIASARLSEAEIVMQKHSIHSLIVVDEYKHLVGIIDYFSCK